MAGAQLRNTFNIWPYGEAACSPKVINYFAKGAPCLRWLSVVQQQTTSGAYRHSPWVDTFQRCVAV